MLAYLSDRSGWWNLWLYDMASGERRQLIQEPVEHGSPTWARAGCDSRGRRMVARSP